MCRLGKAKALSIFLCPALPTRPSQAVVVVKRVLQNLPRAVKGKKAQKKEKHDFREKGIAKQASTLRRPRNKEITINL